MADEEVRATPVAQAGSSSPLHLANSPYGPWTPFTDWALPGCNNPTQMRHPNGTWFIICDSTKMYVFATTHVRRTLFAAFTLLTLCDLFPRSCLQVHWPQRDGPLHVASIADRYPSQPPTPVAVHSPFPTYVHIPAQRHGHSYGADPRDVRGRPVMDGHARPLACLFPCLHDDLRHTFMRSNRHFRPLVQRVLAGQAANHYHSQHPLTSHPASIASRTPTQAATASTGSARQRSPTLRPPTSQTEM